MKDIHNKILTQISWLKENDPSFHAFGAYRWAYTFKPVNLLTVTSLEKKHKLQLPEEFRDFILEIGFGAGPSYGANMSQFLSIEYYEIEEEDDEFYQPMDDGYILLAEHGHGMESVLIVAGAHKGEVWKLTDSDFIKVSDSFLEWYTKWLSTLRKIIENETEVNKIMMYSSFY